MDSLSRSASSQKTPEMLMWLGGVLFTFALWEILLRGRMDLLGALIITVALLIIALRDKGTAAILSLSFLLIIGDARRIMDVAFGLPKLDLLLLVVPVVAVLLGLPLIIKARLRDALSKAVLGLLVLMVLEVLNPQQGGVAVGLSGALFYIAPILWFWIGRRYASPVVVERFFYAALFPLGAAAAILGLFQTFVGFIPYEQAWIDVVSRSYHALYVGKSVRAFGFSVSSAEYATLLAICTAGTVAAYFGKRRVWSVLCFLLFPTLILASSRGLVLKLVVALGVVWTARKGATFSGLALVRLGLVVVVGLVGVASVAAHYAPSQPSSSANNSAAQNLLTHQEEGLAHPLDKRYSTAGLHSGMFLKGIIEGVTDPVGHGLGATSLAGTKFATDSHLGSSEVDVSDMFIDLGVVGGVLYVYIIVVVMRKAVEQTHLLKRSISLPVLAILTLTLGSWLIAGQYSTSSIVFFLIGSLAYEDNRGPKLEAVRGYMSARGQVEAAS